VTPTVRSSRAATEPSDTITPSRPLELVDPDEWRRRRHTRIVIGIVAVVLLASPFVIVVMNVQMAQRQIHLQHLQTQLDAQQQLYESLRAEVLASSSPAGIAHAAAAQGLVQAPGITVVSVPRSDTPAPGNDNGALAASDDFARNKLADAP
jgi:cell division protein FtsL